MDSPSKAIGEVSVLQQNDCCRLWNGPMSDQIVHQDCNFLFRTDGGFWVVSNAIVRLMLWGSTAMLDEDGNGYTGK